MYSLYLCTASLTKEKLNAEQSLVLPEASSTFLFPPFILFIALGVIFGLDGTLDMYPEKENLENYKQLGLFKNLFSPETFHMLILFQHQLLFYFFEEYLQLIL